MCNFFPWVCPGRTVHAIHKGGGPRMEKEWKKKRIVSRAIIVAIALIMILPGVSVLLTDNGAGNVQSQQVIDRYHMPPALFYKGNSELKLGPYSFDTAKGANVPDVLKIDAYPAGVKGYYLVQLNDRVTQDMKAKLEATGAKVGDYVPYNAFVVKMSPQVKDRVASLPFVQSINIYQPQFKASPELWDLTGVLNDPVAPQILTDSLSDINLQSTWDAAKTLGIPGDRVSIKVHTEPGESPYDIAALISKGGGHITDISKGTNGGFVTAEVNPQGIPVLAYLNSVAYIEPWVAHTIMMADTDWTEQSKVAPSSEYETCDVWNHGVTGAGVTIGDSDTGLNTDHEMFFDPSYPTTYGSSHRKVQAYHVLGDNSVDYDGHGTHTNGDAAGYADPTGSTNVNRRGMAYDARISFCDIGKSDDGSGTNDNTLGGIPGDLNTMFQLEYDDGARISTNSWGVPVEDSNGDPTNAEGTYSADAMNTDVFMWNHKDFQVFFSAGNDRSSNPGTGPMTVTPPATAKNTVCVASHRAGSNWNEISTFSSFGPTRDGRLKPDLASTGDGVNDWDGMDSAGNDGNIDGSIDTNYVGMQGTSMSGPVAAGGGALVIQYFQDGYYPVNSNSPVAANGFTPSAALVKAALINGARDATSGTYSNSHPYSLNGHSMDYPNNDQGWGMTDTGDSLYFYDEKDVGREMRVQDFTTGLVTGQNISYEYYLTANQPVEITLVWTDYPGTMESYGALVNDLDLTVSDPAGNTYWGNNYGSTSRESDPTNPAGRDRVNNVECALIKSPTAGKWTITIEGANVPQGAQPFALVVTGDFDDNVAEINIDKIVYGAPDTVNIEVVDPGVSGTLPVMVTSSFGDFENITLTEVASGAGRFTGSIPTELWTATSDDGKLQVNNGGTLTVSYDDASSSLTLTRTADVETATPKITDVHVTDISNVAVTVRWTTDIPATSQVYYGTTTALGSVTTLDSGLVTNHAVAITGLTGFTDYYFDVESASSVGNTARDDNGGTHYRFTTVDNPDVLVIQEDSDLDSSHQRVADWDLSLSYYGWSYTAWETMVYGLPSVDAMNSAKVVLWDVGEGYPQLGSDERAVIQNWIGQSGVQRLYINGQDIGWDMDAAAGGTDPDSTWYHTYMHATFEQDDADGGGGDEGAGGFRFAGGGTDPFRVVGTSHQISTDFVSTGTGTNEQDLEQDIYGTGRFWPDDITNDQGGDATPPWDYNGHAGGGDCSAISYSDSSYRLVYEAFTHFMLQDDDTFDTAGHVFGTDVDPNRAYIADESLIYLLGEDHPDVHVTAPNGGETLSGTTTITWEVPSGGVAASSYDVQVSPDGGQSYTTIASGLTGTSYSWDTTSFLNGDTYVVKVIGYGTTLQGYDVSDANFTIDNGASGDWEGPVIVSGSITSDPEGVEAGQPLTITATADDSAKGDSNIAAAEYFIGSTGADGTGTAMSATDGTFDAVIEDLTWSGNAPSTDGNYTLYVHAQDAAGNWGGYTSIVIHVLPSTTATPTFDIPVHLGWNLISYPLLASGDIETVLNDDVVWDYAQWYNPTDTGDHWKTHVVGRASNDLTSMDNTMGVWLHVTSVGDGYLTVSGNAPTSTAIPLSAGWNLISYPASGSAVMDSAGLPSSVTKIAQYDSAATYLVSEVADWTTNSFVPGNAYWIYTTADATWTVTY